MILASAQIEVEIGNLKSNLNNHLEMIALASKNKATVIVFPEMSLTGYCREEALGLAFTKNDTRLDVLHKEASKNLITIIVGAPILLNENLYIGSFIIQPNSEIKIYTKQFLHNGEELFFKSSFDYNPVLKIEDENIVLAICADIDVEKHAENACKNKATIYMPSIFFSEKGIESGHRILQNYAEKYNMDILMSNYCGKHWNVKGGGKSAFWNNKGEKVGQLNPDIMSLTQRDKKNIWHPLKQHQTHPESMGIVKAKGCILTDEDGNKYIDAISSWYTCMFGHCNDYIIEKAHKQMLQLDQIMFSDFTHPPAVELSEKLIAILPENQAKIFFNDNGSTSVEAAIKMALQYYFNNEEKRTVFIAFENGFHGDTFGAMSTSGLSVYNGPFEDFLMDVKRIPTPNGNNHEEILQLLQKIINSNNIAGFVYEPIVQGAAGMKVHNADGLNEILKLCKANNILTIADEVMTGFGKTGKNFASDYVETKPDIICLSKALTGGLVPMGITSCTQKIYDASIASIDLLNSDEIQNNIQQVITAHQQFDKKIKKHPKVKTTRQIGVIFALDIDTNMERYGALRDILLAGFMKEGVFLRPLGNTIYIQPPYVITSEELHKVYNTIEKVLDTL